MKNTNGFVFSFLKKYIFKNLSDVPRELLVCTKNRHLTLKKDSYDTDELFFVQNGLVFSVRDTLLEYGIASFHYYQDKWLVPRAYFELAEKLDLIIDKESYIWVVIGWMVGTGHSIFYNKLSHKDLPGGFPSEWGDLEVAIVERYKYVWEKMESPDEIGLYGDFFVLNKHGCLVTGYGKTKACKAIASPGYILDMVKCEREASGFSNSSVSCSGVDVEYCVHMLSAAETISDKIIETGLIGYMYYAEDNINLGGNMETFYNLFKNSSVKYLLVPHYDTLEEKSQALEKYFKDMN